MSTGDGKLIAVTPAHNEAAHLDAVIASMVASERRPDLWVVVDDASTDDTGAICDRAAEAHSFMRVLHRERPQGRRLSSKAESVAAGYELARSLIDDSTYVASIDGDVELPPDALTRVVKAFDEDPQLGVTGGIYLHPVDGEMVPTRTSAVHVPGPFQVFRTEVWEAIGGYQPLRYGGLDTVSTAQARMLGWDTRALPDLFISHNRRMGTGGGRHPVSAEYRNGIRDYSLGNDPVFELAKCGARLLDNPRILGSLARFVGYYGSLVTRREPGVPADIRAFIGREHRTRMLQAIGLGKGR